MVSEMPFWAVFCEDLPVGFAALKIHFAKSAEVCVMGVLKEHHRRGIGRRLISCCERFCRENGIEYLTVKTLDEAAKSTDYAKTREFYFSMGFCPLEVFPLLWGEHNPCLLLVKHLG